MRILLIEDDSATARSIELMLRSEHIEVVTRDLGEEGLELARQDGFDLILLDLNLPDMSGLDIIKTLRAEMVHTPIIVQSGTRNVEKKVLSFTLGADQFLSKPFQKPELIATIQVLIRRSKGPSNPVVKIGGYEVDLAQRIARTAAGVRIGLTVLEYKVLEQFVLRRGATISKKEFLALLYPPGAEPAEKIVDVLVCKIRGKIARAVVDRKHHIETVWGCGHVLREPAEGQIAA